MSAIRKNPNALNDYLKRLQEEVGDRAVAVGFPRGKQGAYPDGTEVLMVAAVNEYGTSDGKIPARPFMANSAPKMRAYFLGQARRDAKAVVEGVLSVDTFLARVGEAAKSIVVREIDDGSFEENAESTARRKGSDHPLIDTGHLKQSVSYDQNRKFGDGA